MTKKIQLFVYVIFLTIFLSGHVFAYCTPPLDTGHAQTNTKDPEQPDPPDPPDDDPCKDKNKPASKSKGSPVYVASGDLILTFVDMTIPAPGLSLDIVRSYNSQEQYNGPFGYGWVAEHTVQLVEYTDGLRNYVLIRLADGKRAEFIENADGSYTGLDVLSYDKLVKNDDGTFTLNANCAFCARSSKPEMKFNAHGFLEYMADTKGNKVSFEYDEKGALTRVSTNSGQSMTYTYGANQKVSQIALPNGKSYTYHYDNDNLVSVVDMAGHATVFVYDSNHKLVSIVDADGRTRFLASYDNLGRVTTYSEGQESYTYTYFPDQNKTEKTNSQNQKYTYYYNDDDLITKVENPDGSSQEFTFDKDNNPIAYTDGRGKTWSYTYDDNGNLLTKTDPLGNVWTWTYNDQNKKTSETDPLNATLTYTYDLEGNLLSRTDKEGNTWTYAYNVDGQKLTATDPRNNTTKYGYDTKGNLISITDPLGNVTRYAYDDLGRKVSETNARGFTTYYTYNAAGQLAVVKDALGHDTTMRYDDSGMLVERIDALGNSQKYEYDGYGRLVKTTDSQDHSVQMTYNGEGQKLTRTDALGNVVRWTYDDMGRLSKEYDALGNATTYAYDRNGNQDYKLDANNRKTDFTYNDINQLTELTNPLNQKYTYEYDALGRMLKSVDPLGYVTTKEYDKNGRLVKQVDASGNATTYIYDGVGNMVSKTDQAGNVAAYEYDANNRLVKILQPTGETNSFTYDAVGNRVSETFSNGEKVTFVYDALNRKIEVKDTAGTFVTFEYDALGRKIKKSDGAGNTTSFAYNSVGKQVSMTDPGGGVQRFEYDANGRVTKITDATEAIVTYTYDAAGRILASTDHSGTTSTTYDAVGNRLSITDPKGNFHGYEYDALNRVSKEILPDGTFKQFTYDAIGRKTEELLVSGEKILFEYDVMGRLTKQILPDGNATSYTYDSTGKMLTASNQEGTITRIYDELGRLLQDSQPFGTVTYAYAVTNGTRTITYPSGETVVETYDIRDRLQSIAAGGQTLVDYSYDNATDSIVGTSFANGIRTVYGYDQNGKIIDITHSIGESVLMHHTLERDGIGQITQRTDVLDNGQDRGYAYDPIQRLTEVRNGPEGTTDITKYTLDPVSNRIGVSSSDGIVNATVNNLNQYTVYGGTSLDYDANGNIVDDGTNFYQFNTLGQLIAVRNSGTNATVATYGYDALGRRVTKTVGGTVEQYVYSGASKIVEEYVKGQDVPARINYFSPNTDHMFATRTGGQIYYYLADSRGSVALLTSGAGDVVERYRYDEYGQTTIMDASFLTRNTSAYGNEIMFTGQRLDAETGLYFMTARYYSPILGRFISRDPSGFVDTLNLYEYARSNPINFVDPLGLEAQCQEITTVSWDAAQKIKWLKDRVVIFKGVKWNISGGISFKTEQCKDRCCQHKTGTFVDLSWKQFTLEGKVSASFSNVVPGWGLQVGDNQFGLIGFVELSLAAEGKLSSYITQDCSLATYGQACVGLGGTIGLRLGVDAGDIKGSFGVKAYLEGGLSPGGKLCYTTHGWSGQLCIGGSIKAVGEVRIIWISAGTSYDIWADKVCVGNENL
jgi:RHS repeat-associated protein